MRVRFRTSRQKSCDCSSSPDQSGTLRRLALRIAPPPRIFFCVLLGAHASCVQGVRHLSFILSDLRATVVETHEEGPMVRKIARREFFQTAASAGIGFGAASPLAAAFGADAPNNKIVVAVMGTNSRGASLARSFARVPGAE